jgi:cold shock CspA family protein
MKGQVLKPLEINPMNLQQPPPPSDPLPGRIKYRAADHSEVEVPYGDKDQKGDFTLRHGDWVQFLLATDRRDQLQRATCISLLEETFQLSGEKREQGVVVQLKDGFGFIRCVERSVRLFFHFTEVLDTSRELTVGDEIEFTIKTNHVSVCRQVFKVIKNSIQNFFLVLIKSRANIELQQPSFECHSYQTSSRGKRQV